MMVSGVRQESPIQIAELRQMLTDTAGHGSRGGKRQEWVPTYVKLTEESCVAVIR